MNSELRMLLHLHSSLTLAYASAQYADEALLRHLLQADLLHQRLLHHLIQAGLCPDPFFLDLHRVLFPLMGFSQAQQDSNELQHFYFGLLERYKELPLPTYLLQTPTMVHEILSALREWNEQHPPHDLRYENLPF